jgi:hypothetical protein
MAVTARFLADFSDFSRAVKDAEVQLKGMETNAGKVSTSLNKMADSLSGRKLVQDATLAAAAVDKIGGVTKLTATELQRLGAQANDAIAKLQAIGKDVPPGIQKIATAAKQAEDALAKIKADNLQKVAAAAKQAEDAMAKAAKPGMFSDLTSQVKATALGFVSATAIIGAAKAAFGALTEFVSSSVAAYAAQESAVKRMTTALQTQGTATPQVIGQFKDMASQFQNTTVYADELVNEMQALLVQVGNVMPSQMKGALKAATDLASGLGIDLRTATMLVGKAFEGETGTLKRYGIVIDEAKLKTEGVTAVMDAIQSKFGGQAQSEIETYAGKVKQLANAWDEVKEAVGRNVVENPFLVAALRIATEESKKHAEAGAAEGDELKRRLQPLGILGFAYLELAERVNAANIAVANFNRVVAQAPKMPDFSGGLTPPPSFGQNPLDVKKYLDDEAEAQRKEAAAAVAHAAAVKALMDAYSGAKAIKDANMALEAVNKNLKEGKTVAMMTRDEQNKLNDVVKLAIRAYESAGRIVPPELRKIYNETFHLRQEMEKLALIKIDPVKQIGKLPTNLQGGTVENQIPLIPRSSLFADMGLPTSIPGLDKLIIETKEGAEATTKLAHEAAKAREAFKQYGFSLRDVSQALAQLGQVSGGAFGGMLADLATLAGAADTAAKGMQDFSDSKKSFTEDGASLSNIAGMATGILGIASAAIAAGKAIKNMFFGTAGRDIVKDFAGSEGGFDALHAKLGTLGAEGEKLWIALTQGVGRNNPKEAQAAVDAIVKAFGAFKSPEDEIAAAGFKTIAQLQAIADTATRVYESMRDSGLYSAAAIQEAWERANAAAIAAGDQQAIQAGATRAAIQKLNDEIKSLTDSIANEAPEEVMGVIEAQTRARIEAIEAERDAAQLALEDTATQAAEAAEDAAVAIEDVLAGHDFRVKIHFDVDDLPNFGGGAGAGAGIHNPSGASGGPYTFAGGTHGRYLDFGAGRRVTLHGRERVMTEEEGRAEGGSGSVLQFPTGGGGTAQPIIIQTFLDGRMVAEAVVPHVPDVVKRYGLA